MCVKLTQLFVIIVVKKLIFKKKSGVAVISRFTFLIKMILSVHLRQSSLFCGPGMSLDVGVGCWDEFARKAIQLTDETVKKKKLKVSFNANYLLSHLNGELKKALYVLDVCESILNKKRLLQLLSIHNSFGFDEVGGCVAIKHGELHKELANIPFLCVWTNNLDQLIEEAFTEEKRQYKLVDRQSNAHKMIHVFSYEQLNKDIPIYKLYGTCKRAESINDIVDVSFETTLTGNDYTKLNVNAPLLINHLAITLKYSQMLFLGYTFPEQDEFLINTMLEQSKPEIRHLALMTTSQFYDSKNRLKEANIDVCIVDDMNEMLKIMQITRKYGAMFWKH